MRDEQLERLDTQTSGLGLSYMFHGVLFGILGHTGFGTKVGTSCTCTLDYFGMLQQLVRYHTFFTVNGWTNYVAGYFILETLTDGDCIYLPITAKIRKVANVQLPFHAHNVQVTNVYMGWI